MRNWKRRSFLLTRHSLAYYEDAESDAPKGVIPLRDIASINVNPRRRGSFEIKTVTGKDFVILARSDDEKEEWVAAIQRALMKPSKLAQLLRTASEFERDGKISRAQKEAIKDMLVSGEATSLAEAERMMHEAYPPDTAPAPEAVELLLQQFASVSRAASLLNVLNRLIIVLGNLPAPDSVRRRIVNIGERHRLASEEDGRDTRWSEPVAAAFERVLAEFDSKNKGTERSSTSKADGADSGGTGGAGGASPPRAARLPRHSAIAVSPPHPPSPAPEGSPTAHTTPATRADASPGAAEATAPAGGGAEADADAAAAAKAAATAAREREIEIHTGGAWGGDDDAGPEASAGTTQYVDAAGDRLSKARSWHMMAGVSGDPEFVRRNAERIEAMNAIARGAPLADIDEAREAGFTDVLEEEPEEKLDEEEEGELPPPPPPQSDTFEEDYVIGKKIGEGGYSVVHECVHRRLGHRSAVKIVEKSRLDVRETAGLHQEVKVMRELRHPNIVQLEAFYEGETSFYIVTELMTGGELFDRIVQKTHYTEREAQHVVRTLAKALEYCHRKGIVHRDLKPENILLSCEDESEAVIKIADMGFARPVLDSGMETSCGTPSYVAPEILLGQRYGTAVDLWSLGIITYILLCGYAPFQHPQQNQLFRLIIRGNFYFDSPYWDGVSDQAKHLIRHLLVTKSRKRYSAKQVLAHPWVAGSPAATTELGSVQSQMRMFNSRRRRTVKRGVLTKRGHVVKNWKRRAFQLTGEDLQYYSDEDSTVPRGVVSLSDITHVASAEDAGVDVDTGGRENVFVLFTSSGRDYLLQAATAAQRREWVRALTSTHQHLDLMRKAQTAYRARDMDGAQDLISMARQWEHMRDALADAERSRAASGAAGSAPTTTHGGAGAGGRRRSRDAPSRAVSTAR